MQQHLTECTVLVNRIDATELCLELFCMKNMLFFYGIQCNRMLILCNNDEHVFIDSSASVHQVQQTVVFMLCLIRFQPGFSCELWPSTLLLLWTVTLTTISLEARCSVLYDSKSVEVVRLYMDLNRSCFVFAVQDPVLSSPPTGPLPQPPRISLPSPTASLCNSAPSLPPPRSETLPVAHRGGRKIPNHARVQSLPGINERMNGDLEEWQNGQPANRTSRQAPPSAPPIIGPRDNHLTLRFVPPPPTSAIQRRSCILSTIPDRLVFEETPTPENSTTEYDHPRQSYYHQTPTADESNNNNNFGALRFSPGGLYNVPNRSAFRGTEPECLYKIPPRHSANFSNVDDVRYDVPASTRLSYDVPAKCLGQHSLSGEHYDVPQSSAPVGPRVQSPSQNGVNPVDIIESSHLLSVLQSLIDELPTLSSSSNSATGDRIPKTPLYCNMDGQQGGCLDGKISSRELLSLSPPVPGPGTVEMVQHSYINAANGNTERVARSPTTSVSSSTSPSSGNLQCKRDGYHPHLIEETRLISCALWWQSCRNCSIWYAIKQNLVCIRSSVFNSGLSVSLSVSCSWWK